MSFEEWILLDEVNKKEHWQVGLEAYRLAFPERLAFANRVKANPSIYHMKLLARELGGSIVPVVLPSPAPVVESEPELEPQLDIVLPTDVQSRYEELLQDLQSLFNRKAKLSNTLADYAVHDDAGRALVVGEIIALRNEYNRLAVVRKFVERHGHFPEAGKESEEENLVHDKLLELRERLRAEHTNKSKKVKRLKDAEAKQDKEKILHYQNEIARHIKVIQDLNSRIKLLSSKNE